MKFILLLFPLLLLPVSVSAMESSFIRDGLKASIKLTPDDLQANTEVQLNVSLSRNGVPVTDKDVSVEVFSKNDDNPIIARSVDVLDNDYIDSWKLSKPGEYKIVIKIADHQKLEESIQYEAHATVAGINEGHKEHNFLTHHLSDHWGWWGVGMLIMMPLMIVL